MRQSIGMTRFTWSCLAVLVTTLSSQAWSQNPSAKDVLETIQRDAYLNEWKIDEAQLDKMVEARETHYVPWCVLRATEFEDSAPSIGNDPGEARRWCESKLAAIPTRYQDPLKYHVVSNRYKDVVKAASALSYGIDYEPLIGSSPSGESNADAVREHGHRILVVNDGLIDLGWGLSRIITLALPNVTERLDDPFHVQWEEVKLHIQSSPHIQRQFNRLLDGARTPGLHYRVGDYTLERDQYRFTNALNRGAQLFLVGHEYSHLFQGHLEGMTRSRPSALFAKKPIELAGGAFVLPASIKFRQELDADEAGLWIASKACRAADCPIEAALYGAILVLRAAELSKLETGTAFDLCDIEAADTTKHPPTGCRVIALATMPGVSPKALSDILLIERILDFLWVNYPRVREQ